MSRHVKRVTLTSKKNWWMVELDDDEDDRGTHTPAIEHHATGTETPGEEAHSSAQHSHRRTHKLVHRQSSRTYESTPHASEPVFNVPRNPASIFSFPTPTSYSAPPNPTEHLAPCAAGSASELFKCVVKKPNVVQLEINGEMQSNANDVITQFLAELRVYTTVARHRNITAFLGSLENVGMVLEYLDGRTLYDVIREQESALPRHKRIDFHNQLLDGLTHLHSFGLSHGDLSLLNVQVTVPSDTIKLLDFGRSVSANSTYINPDDEMMEPPPPPASPLSRFNSRFAPRPPPTPLPPPPMPTREREQIHPGTRPFSAPEVLRGECQDPRLADAYGFGMVLVCLDRCDLVDVKPWVQRKDALPPGFLDGLELFGDRCRDYLKRWDAGRRRLLREDIMEVDVVMAL